MVRTDLYIIFNTRNSIKPLGKLKSDEGLFFCALCDNLMKFFVKPFWSDTKCKPFCYALAKKRQHYEKGFST